MTVPEQITEILSPIGIAKVVTHNRFSLVFGYITYHYVVYISKEIISGDESEVIRKCKQHLVFCQATQRDFEARMKEIHSGHTERNLEVK